MQIYLMYPSNQFKLTASKKIGNILISEQAKIVV